MEVERLLELVGTHEERRALGRRAPGLTDGHPVAVVLGQDLPPAPEHVVALGLLPHRAAQLAALEVAQRVEHVGQPLLLEQRMRHVDPEPVDAAVEPEPQRLLEVRGDLGVAPVEVGLGDVEEVEVPLAVGHPLPGRAAEHGEPVVGRLRPVGTTSGPEHVAVALGAARRRLQRLLEPQVLAGGVVGHDVGEQLQSAGVGLVDEGVEVVEGAVRRLDVAEVDHVVAVVVLRRGVERVEPQRVDAEVDEVVEVVGDPLEVTLPVTVGVGEAADVELIADGVAPPRVRHAFSWSSSWLKTSGSTATQTCSARPTIRPSGS